VRYIYRTYSLTLESDRSIQALSALSGSVASADLVCALEAMPDWARDALALPLTSYRVRPSELIAPGDAAFTVSEYQGGLFFQLAYGDGTRFVIERNVTRLWGEPGPGLTHDDVCVYLLGPVMGFVLRQRGLTCLHASALTIQGRAIALVGEAGAGKSTTAAALAIRGWPVLCEDVCGLDRADRQFMVRPAYPRVCLWPDSVDFLFSSRDALPLIVNGWEKRFLALDDARARFASSSTPLAAIFLLAGRTDEASAPRLEPLARRDAVLQLVQNTYMNWLLSSEQRAAEFDVLTSLVSATECFRLFPSTDPARLPALVELIEKQTLRVPAGNRYPAVDGTSSNV